MQAVALARIVTSTSRHAHKRVRRSLSAAVGQHRTAMWLLLITAVAAALRLYGLAREPLWMDEAASFGFARLPLSALWAQTLDPNPPLYYTLQKLTLLFGSSETALRALSAVLGTACVPLTFCLGRLVGGTRCGLVAAALLATSALQLEYSQEARGYVLLMAAALVLVWSAAKLFVIYDPRTEPGASVKRLQMAWAGYVFAALAAVYTHNTALTGWALINAFLLGAWLIRFERNPRFFRHWLTANGLVLLAWAWWLPALIGQSVHELRDFWIWPPTASQALAMAGDVYGQMYVPYGQPFVTFAFVLPGIAGSWLLAKRQPWFAVLLAGIVVLVPLLSYLASLYRPVMLTRTILWPLPLFLVLAAVVIASMRARAAAALLLVLLCVQTAGAVNYFAHPVKGEPWDRIVRHIRQNGTGNAPIIFCAADGDIPFSYYAARFGASMKRFGLAEADEPEWRRRLVHALAPDLPVVAPQDLSRATGEFAQLWLIDRLCPDPDRIRSILAPSRTAATPVALGDIRVLLFERGASVKSAGE